MDIIKENVNNLTSLWRLVGERARIRQIGEQFDLVAVTYSEWPNRLWFHDDVNENLLGVAKNSILQTDPELIVPYWDIYRTRNYKLLEANGFEKRSEQYGMSLKLNRKFPKNDSLRLDRVTNAEKAGLWADLFQQSFGYHINPSLVALTQDAVDYFIAYHQDTPVGTAILYGDNSEVVGIHSMGIIPEFRRRGFAEEMMRDLLYRSRERRFIYAVLQASASGKGLYLKLGFKEQFILKNYALLQGA